MRVGVVADLMALAHHPFHQADIFLCFGADHHERALDVLLLQDVENFRRPLGVRAVVKGERNFIRMVAVVLDGVGARIHIHVLTDNELLARVGFVRVNRYGALAGLGQAGDAHDVALAFVVHVVTGPHGGQLLQRVGVAGLVPDIPQRTVLRAQPPERKGLQAQSTRGAQFV